MSRRPAMPSPSLTRRRCLAAAAALAAVTPRVARAQSAVKIGTAVLGDYSMAGPVIVALEKGFFKDEGLAAEFIPFRGGPDLLKAVMAGEGLLRVTGSTRNPLVPQAGPPLKGRAAPPPG